MAIHPPTPQEIRQHFITQGVQSTLWVPTKTRNDLIADCGFASHPTMTAHGRVHRFKFTSIGGGMWEVALVKL
jgi:hypothetical protein